MAEHGILRLYHQILEPQHVIHSKLETPYSYPWIAYSIRDSSKSTSYSLVREESLHHAGKTFDRIHWW